MKPLNKLTGIVLPLEFSHVDTDQIIPKQFLKSLERTGFADNLFDGWRYLDEGQPGQNPNERRLNRDFILNHAAYQDAKILLALDNFGCGSSREHAVWALAEYGFRCVIASSFADIFHNNCIKNGVLPITLDEALIKQLFALVKNQPGISFSVDLKQQTILLPDGEAISFSIQPFDRNCLLNGFDEISLTLEHADKIRTYETNQSLITPWLFADKAIAEDKP